MTKLILPVESRDHMQGSLSAPVVLLEYGDYQCPYCGAAYPVVKKLQEKLGSKLCFVFRNFPLTSMHEHAEHAAEAAEAAGTQGKFWEMHDRLYENQAALSDRDLLEHGRALGLDLKKYRSNLEQHSFLARVKEDFTSGVRSGVQGTPTFFINGVRHDRGVGYADLLSALENAPRRS